MRVKKERDQPVSPCRQHGVTPVDSSATRRGHSGCSALQGHTSSPPPSTGRQREARGVNQGHKPSSGICKPPTAGLTAIFNRNSKTTYIRTTKLQKWTFDYQCQRSFLPWWKRSTLGCPIGYTSHLKCDQYRELNFNFYFMLVNLNLNSHVSWWLPYGIVQVYAES